MNSSHFLWIMRGRRSHSGRVQPIEMHRIALAIEKIQRLLQRQADDIRGRTDELQHEGAGLALDGVAACLAAPFSAREIGVEIITREPLEPHPRLDQALAPR